MWANRMSAKLYTYPLARRSVLERIEIDKGPSLYSRNGNYVDEEEMSPPPEREG